VVIPFYGTGNEQNEKTASSSEREDSETHVWHPVLSVGMQGRQTEGRPYPVGASRQQRYDRKKIARRHCITAGLLFFKVLHKGKVNQRCAI
jgi:hypothetical protein